MLNAADVQVRRTTTTDGEGRYRIADLPAGRYFLAANKAGYVSAQYGQRRPNEPGTAVQLSDGQSMTGVNLALPRGGVIAGRVIDEFGEPIARASVQALRYFYGPDGQRRPAAEPVAARPTTSDSFGSSACRRASTSSARLGSQASPWEDQASSTPAPPT